MKPGQVTTEMAARYFRLFVNRLAYTVQSDRPDSKGKHYYYRPRDQRQLTRDSRTLLRTQVRRIPTADDLESFECLHLSIQGTGGDSSI